MEDNATSKEGEIHPDGWPLKEVWEKYEEITMHFNDLLIRLRTQALAAVAALATIVGIFAKSGADTAVSWQMIAFAFAILCVFWIAIWVLDFRYYNRLLLGAVIALVELEKQSADKLRIRHINISTTIEDAVAGKVPPADKAKARKLGRGRWLFYILVFGALVCGLLFSLYQYRNTQPTNAKTISTPTANYAGE